MMMTMTTTIRCERCISLCISALLCAFRACVCMCVIKFIRTSMVIVCLQVTSRARFFLIFCSSVHFRHQSIHGNANRSFSSSYHPCHHHYRNYRCNTMLLPSMTTRETCTSSRFSSHFISHHACTSLLHARLMTTNPRRIATTTPTAADRVIVRSLSLGVSRHGWEWRGEERRGGGGVEVEHKNSTG